MRHFSTLLCILALGLALETATSCTKDSVAAPTTNNNIVVRDYKVNQSDTTGTYTADPSSGGHNCGNGGTGGDHSNQY
jgi:hypothetical protein